MQNEILDRIEALETDLASARFDFHFWRQRKTTAECALDGAAARMESIENQMLLENSFLAADLRERRDKKYQAIKEVQPLKFELAARGEREK